MGKGFLHVYRASAGSGKTFRLTVEYLKLLMDDPTVYRHILAVTFTNKATNEMKTRIMSQLYGISHSLPDSESYVEVLRQEGDWGERQIRHRCGQALQFMMHDYGRFSITTIDAFFQTILRQLIQELDLPSNLRVDLDSESVLKEAVDLLMDEMTHDDNLLHSVLAYVESKMKDGHSWNVVNNLNEFGKHIFSEQYLEHSHSVRQRLEDKKVFITFRKMLDAYEENVWRDLANTADTYFDTCNQLGIDENTLSKKAPKMFPFFASLKNRDKNIKTDGTTIRERAENGNAWLNKEQQSKWGDLVQTHLVPLLQHALQVLDSPTFVTVPLVRKNLYQLSLIADIDRCVRQLNESANRFLLADTAQVLSQLIADSDVPFIYERTGTRIDHIMIDEMQDTSRMQWRNFKPLILNSLSAGCDCLLVGDVKQSIYRWRNGDWGILNNLEKDTDFSGKIKSIPGKTNFRSRGRVVSFNNAFFEQVADKMAASLPLGGTDVRKAYESVRQNVPIGRENDGYVHVDLINEQLKAEQRIQAEAELVWQSVQTLLAAGVEQNDIAILVRKNKHIPALISFFQQKAEGIPFNVVSNEAFQLDASLAVRLLVQAIRVAARPNDALQQAILSHMLDEQGCSYVGDCAASSLPSLSTNETLPLRELCANLCEELHLNEMAGQDAYLFYFFDQLSAFISDHGSDLEAFLRLWDDKMHRQSIPANSMDGLRILSIHKAKGLEFNSVIVPFCEWELDADSRTCLWCEPQQPPFDFLPLLPLNYDSKIKSSLFREEALAEQMKSCVDSLNLLYVAFTRAADNLFVIGGKNSSKASIFSVLQDTLQQFAADGNVRETSGSNESVTTYETGEICVRQHKSESTENVLLQAPAPIDTRFRYGHSRLQFLQSNESFRFVHQADTPDTASAERSQYIDEGLLFHSLLASVRTLDDLPAAMDRLETHGLCPDTHTRDHLATMLQEAFSDEQARDWFHPRWTVFNEQEILCLREDGIPRRLRPDRVITDGRRTLVIDYKTGQPHPDHAQQVHQYIDRLRDMGHTDTTGFLWYVRDHRIVECK